MTKRMFLVNVAHHLFSAATVFRGDIEKPAEKKENDDNAIGSHVTALEDASSKRTPVASSSGGRGVLLRRCR